MRSLEELIPKLREATEAKKLAWHTDGGGYQCKLGEHFIDVYEWTDPDSNSSGVTAYLSRTGDRSDLMDEVVADEYASRFAEVSALLSAARRSALKVDEAIDDIEKQLNKL